VFYDLILNAYKDVADGPTNLSGPEALLRSDLTLHAINLDADPEPDGVITWKLRPAGSKINSLGYEDSRAAQHATLNEFKKLIRTTGFYAEVSSPLSDHVWKRIPDAKVVEDEAQVRAILNKDITWLGKHPGNKAPHAGWYRRKINGKDYTKILIGLPR